MRTNRRPGLDENIACSRELRVNSQHKPTYRDSELRCSGDEVHWLSAQSMRL
jgi:hypothetical protein